MDRYGKMIIIGAIGLTIVAIIWGISGTSATPGFSFSVSQETLTDILVLYFITQLPADDPLRTILLFLWIFGFFAPSEE
ncbi:MAG: hypothetical protein ACTSRG_04320 [Candidatus Helarchaeota archaeon]